MPPVNGGQAGHGSHQEINFFWTSSMNLKPVLHLSSRKLAIAVPILIAFGCVDLTPPWDKNRGRDGGNEVALPFGGTSGTPDNTGSAGAPGGTGGSSDTKGSGGSDSVDAAVAPENDALDAPVEPGDTRSPDTRGYDTGSGGAGGISGDAARDLSTGGTGAGGSGASGGNSQGGRTTGGTGGGAGSGGRSTTGGSATGGSSTGGRGGVDAGAADAASRCLGYLGSPSDGGISNGLLAYYSCDQSSGATLLDQSGKKRDATLSSGGTGGASGATSFVTGKFGNAVSLAAAQDGYASLPANLLNGACEATISTWVYLNSSPTWQRVWDFGRDTTSYMFLTTSDLGQKLKFAISNTGNQNESTVVSDALPLNTWKHVAVILDANGATLFVDGVQTANNPAALLRPADLGDNLNNYIGRSQFPDPYLDGKIDEFRVYNRALSSQEIQALFAGP
jgi:hypothetical protein